MTEKYKPKQGDRVRVVLEGRVRLTENGFWIGEAGESNQIQDFTGHVVSVEKLAPPEPKWVHGAAVRVNGQTFYYDVDTQNGWRVVGGTMEWSSLVSAAWQNGTLEILWNGDSDD